MKAISLKTEYLKNPIGIDINYPRFFWKCDGGIKQAA
jgi:alpha-L-rhamnosidase